MLKKERIDASEDRGNEKTNDSHECILCHQHFFFKNKFKYQKCICDGCHYLLHKSMNFDDTEIIILGMNDYRTHFGEMSKAESAESNEK